jgi:hypothetical protein
MSQLATYLRRLGGPYAHWLHQHDEAVAKATIAKVIKELESADSACSSWAIAIVEGMNK